MNSVPKISGTATKINPLCTILSFSIIWLCHGCSLFRQLRNAGLQRTACGAMLLVVTFLCIIPAGFIYSQVEHVSLKKVAQESGAAGETVETADGR